MGELWIVLAISCGLAFLSEKYTFAWNDRPSKVLNYGIVVLLIAYLSFFAGLRTGYNDTYTYMSGYKAMAAFPDILADFSWKLGDNPGFTLLNSMMKAAGFSAQTFVLTYSILFVAAAVSFLKKYSSSFTLSKSLFVYDGAEKNMEYIFAALVEGRTNNWAGSYMVRTSALFAFYPDREIYQSRYGQNLQFLMPLTYRKKCGFIDEPQMNYNIQANSLSQTSDQQECMARTLRNGEGYLDIRLHLIEQVIRDPEERQKYVQIAKVAYHRSVLNRAVSLRDKVVTREAYGNLKRDHALTISDTIEYCAMFCPCVVFPLRCIRKLTRVLKKGNAGRRATHEHHTNS